ncbi:MAG: 50S ribosomal protein L23 [Candidatus Berkelbacteria bacterium Athens1014_28]|uniref:Large ribosomal subunit protein uL23 n=1 Tax=Candidatus Berkelbacteria bacterium Athens1014_28 TaxID=2017145 RepID=A0A554LQX1_9BACT|nr:MAG: 50S ribosomal protein L23 [Candidatus Berkelbacteria bacterium Athens1014_28]
MKSVVLAPIITEKGVSLSSNNVYAFLVSPSANKHLVSCEIKQIFKVDVVSVNIINIPGKIKRSGKKFGKRSDIKKAYVRIKSGQKIAVFESEEEKKDKKVKSKDNKDKKAE